MQNVKKQIYRAINNLHCHRSVLFVCFLVVSQQSMALQVLPEFSIETKDDLDNATIELTIFKSRSHTFRRNEVNQILTNEEKVKFAKILNASRYGRNDSMYWNGPISKEYEEISYINISSSSGIHSRYWIEVTKDLKNWRLTHNKESFSSSIAGLYFDETQAIEDFMNFDRVEKLNYWQIPVLRWIAYLFFLLVLLVFVRKKLRWKKEAASA